MAQEAPPSTVPVRPVSRRRSRVAAFIRELETVGPDFAEISRRMGEPEDRIRYLFKSTITKNGYVVAGRVNRTALGLRDVYALVEIADRYQDSMIEIITGMDDHWFLNGFYRMIPEGVFLLAFSTPEEHYDEFPRLLDGMVESGMVKQVKGTIRTSWKRFSYMNAEIFDFRRASWEFDWTHIPPPKPFMPPTRSAKQRFDSTDIKILFERTVNATTPLIDIARKYHLDSREVHLHAAHIAEAGLMKGCGVHWHRSHINLETGKPYAPRHRFAFVFTIVQPISLEEQVIISEKLSVLPFTWMEAGGEGYLVQLGIPLEQVVETLSYLRGVLRPVADRSATMMADPGCARGYSPPLELIDDSKGDWIFDIDGQVRRLREQLEVARANDMPSAQQG